MALKKGRWRGFGSNEQDTEVGVNRQVQETEDYTILAEASVKLVD